MPESFAAGDELNLAAVEGLGDAGPFGDGLAVRLRRPLERPVLVRPVVADLGFDWMTAFEEAVRPERGSRVAIAAKDTLLAASIARDAAAWMADRGRRVVLVDASVESPVIGKALLEDGDEGLVDGVVFGVSPSILVRRTLAAGVRLVTSGSYPVSARDVFESERFERTMDALDREGVVLVVIAAGHVDVALRALTTVVAVGRTAAEIESIGRTLAGIPPHARPHSVAMLVTDETVSAAEGEPVAGEVEREEPVPEPPPEQETGMETEAPHDRRERPPEAETSPEGETALVPAEMRPAVEEPAEPEPVAMEPAVAPPVEQEPADTEPGSAEPTEQRPGEAKPASVAPPEAEPTEAPPPQGEPVETEPSEEKPSEEEVTGEKPTEERPAEERPAPKEQESRRPRRRRSSRPEEKWRRRTPDASRGRVIAAPPRQRRERKHGTIVTVAALLALVPVIALIVWRVNQMPDASWRFWEREEPLTVDTAVPPTSEEQAPAGKPAGVASTEGAAEETGAPEEGQAEGEQALAREAEPEEPGPEQVTEVSPGAAGERPAVEVESGAAGDETGVLRGPGGPFRVFVSSHRQESAAGRDVAELAGRGFDAAIIRAELPGRGVWFRVAVTGGYASVGSASEVLDTMKELGYEGAWVERVSQVE